MNARILLTVAALLVVGPGVSLAAEPASTADLFPSDTLAYAELTNPAELSPQLAAVFKGTLLEDSIPFVHKRKDAATTLMDLNGKREIAALGLLASPEMMAEFKKLRGIAIGLVGFSKGGEPEIAMTVLTGDSPAAGLAARAFITMSPSLRKIGEVSKVPVFQYSNPNINYDMNGVPMVQNDKPPQEHPHDFTFAYTPGLVVIGSSKTACSHAIKRFLGEEKTSLGELAQFKQAAISHRQTGLFYFVNFPEFARKYDAVVKMRGGVSEPDLYAWLKLIANAKTIKTISGNLRFRDGGLAATVAATFDRDPDKKSPLMEFLSGSGAKVELLQHARRPAALAFGVALPENNRAEAVIGLLDAIAKSNGELGKHPSDVVNELEEKFKLSLRGDLLGKTRALTVVMPARQELPKDANPMPIVVLHTENAAVAQSWLEAMPKIIANITGAASLPQASSESIGTIKVLSLPADKLPWNAPIHYAANGSIFAFGLDRKMVAASVTPDAASSVVGGDKSSLTATGKESLIGVVALADVLPLLLEKPKTIGPVMPVEDVPPPLGFNGLPIPEEVVEGVKKSRKEFLATLAALPPATVLVNRTGNELRIELFQPKVQGGLKAVIDSGSNFLDKWGGMMSGTQVQFDQFGRAIYGKW